MSPVCTTMRTYSGAVHSPEPPCLRHLPLYFQDDDAFGSSGLETCAVAIKDAVLRPVVGLKVAAADLAGVFAGAHCWVSRLQILLVWGCAFWCWCRIRTELVGIAIVVVRYGWGNRWSSLLLLSSMISMIECCDCMMEMKWLICLVHTCSIERLYVDDYIHVKLCLWRSALNTAYHLALSIWHVTLHIEGITWWRCKRKLGTRKQSRSLNSME